MVTAFDAQGIVSAAQGVEASPLQNNQDSNGLGTAITPDDRETDSVTQEAELAELQSDYKIAAAENDPDKLFNVAGRASAMAKTNPKAARIAADANNKLSEAQEAQRLIAGSATKQNTEFSQSEQTIISKFSDNEKLLFDSMGDNKKAQHAFVKVKENTFTEEERHELPDDDPNKSTAERMDELKSALIELEKYEKNRNEEKFKERLISKEDMNEENAAVSAKYKRVREKADIVAAWDRNIRHMPEEAAAEPNPDMRKAKEAALPIKMENAEKAGKDAKKDLRESLKKDILNNLSGQGQSVSPTARQEGLPAGTAVTGGEDEVWHKGTQFTPSPINNNIAANLAQQHTEQNGMSRSDP